MSDEQYSDWKYKLSMAHKNKPAWNKGKHLTAQHKQNLSKSHLGYVMPEEQKEKISRSCSKTWNLPEMKEKNRQIQLKKFKDGTHNLIEIIKIRQANARIDCYDLKKSEWKKLRENIKKRDNYTCQSCGCDLHQRKSNCHHIVPYSISHDNSPENLTTLCIPCHASIEFYLKKALLRVGGEEVETG